MKITFFLKQRIAFTILVLINLFNIPQSMASEPGIKPFVKGSFQQIQIENKKTPYIVTFWSESCAFCMKELALFGKELNNYPNVKLISITTDPFLEDKVIDQILLSKNISNVEKWVFANDHVERLYFDVSRRWRGELPLTYFVDKNNKMRKHLGIINEKELINWLNIQASSTATQ